jgi:hypothetical protein
MIVTVKFCNQALSGKQAFIFFRSMTYGCPIRDDGQSRILLELNQKEPSWSAGCYHAMTQVH